MTYLGNQSQHSHFVRFVQRTPIFFRYFVNLLLKKAIGIVVQCSLLKIVLTCLMTIRNFIVYMHLHDILVGLINSLKCYFYETFSFPVAGTWGIDLLTSSIGRNVTALLRFKIPRSRLKVFQVRKKEQARRLTLFQVHQEQFVKKLCTYM